MREPIIACRSRGDNVTLLVVCGLLVPLAVAAQTFSIPNHAIVNAGSATGSNGCSRLTATVGEATAGYSGNATFSLLAGFQATVPATGGDTLYFHGFEGCVP